MISHLAFCLFRELHEIFYVKKYNQNVQNANLWIPYDLQTVPRDQNSEKKQSRAPLISWSLLKYLGITIPNYHLRYSLNLQENPNSESVLVVAANHTKYVAHPSKMLRNCELPVLFQWFIFSSSGEYCHNLWEADAIWLSLYFYNSITLVLK